MRAGLALALMLLALSRAASAMTPSDMAAVMGMDDTERVSSVLIDQLELGRR